MRRLGYQSLYVHMLVTDLAILKRVERNCIGSLKQSIYAVVFALSSAVAKGCFIVRLLVFFLPSGFGQIKKYVPIFTVSHLGFLMQRSSLNLIKETET